MNHSWAKPGVKCVCVDDCHWSGWGTEITPVKGGIYTIRGAESYPAGVGLHFIEIVNAPKPYRIGIIEASFHIRHFRPLVTRTEEQDIKLFKHLLSDHPVEERV